MNLLTETSSLIFETPKRFSDQLKM